MMEEVDQIVEQLWTGIPVGMSRLVTAFAFLLMLERAKQSGQ